jgi:serine protease Do
MRRAFAVWIVLLVGGGCAHTSQVGQRHFLYEDLLRDATVYIRGCGSGFLLGDQLVVTNAHVADCIAARHNGYAMIDFLDGTSMPAWECARSTEKYVDLALLKLSGRVGRSTMIGLPVQMSELRKDEVLLSIGNPAPSRWIPTTFRVVVQPRRVDGGLNGVIVMEGAAYYGESGSPVMTMDGQIVGVLFARSEGHAYAIPVQPYLYDLVREVTHADTAHKWP